MKSASMILLGIFVSVAFGVADLAAQNCPGCGWARGSDYDRRYDVGSVETVTGEVLSVEHFTPAKGMSSGIHLLLKTETEEISVHLGPAWYIENQSEKLEVGDAIDVTGSRVTFADSPELIAATVKKGDSVLTLRDEAGYPIWSGWRQGDCACGHGCGHACAHCARGGARRR